MKIPERDGFASRFGILVAVAGSAVGLGNLWRFPYLVGNNGGAAFILIYLLFVFLLCLPIMFSEFVIGRRTGANVFGAMKKLAPRSGWLSIGVISVVTSFCILSFYSVVGGWTVDYIIRSFSPGFLTADSGALSDTFKHFISSPLRPAVMMLIFLGLSALIVSGGIKNGIERYSKILMPVLFLLIVILAIRSVTLPGASQGVNFLFNPDFSKLKSDSILAALGQAFFSLSLGMGCIITYGSYVKKKESIVKISVISSLADTLFAILAGLAILPAVFAFGISPGEGPGLVFITLPQIFAQMPGGMIISAAFFVILLVAALTSEISLLEVVVAYLTEELKLTRRTAVVLTFAVAGFFGLLCSLSEGTLSEYRLFGKNIFDLFDYTASNILLPAGGLLMVMFTGWKMKKADLLDELTNGGMHTMSRYLFKGVVFSLKFLAPVAITFVLLYGLGLIKLF
ncbi:MAG: sodium-dependent transporter [Bacteroidales bacterium]|nr:sodium-dependent transporter [Bacteroidales bacterium]MDD2424802.1 sodium-dependent transporter [Bacteroidales bacterium]MDD3989947.1 sodium-dependent transporter [Bacteroidales bacterium]